MVLPVPGLKRAVALYFGVGYALNSALHTWYVAETYGAVRVGVAFASPGAGIEPSVAYAGALVLGMVAGTAMYGWLLRLPRQSAIRTRDFLSPGNIGLAVVLAPSLVLLSQVVGGASWSKAILDVVLTALAAVVVVSSVVSVSYWDLVSFYAAVVSVLLTVGSQWLEFSGRLEFPNFPAFAYFALAAIYMLGASFVPVVVYNTGSVSASPAGRRPPPAGSGSPVARLGSHRERLSHSFSRGDPPSTGELLGFFDAAAEAMDHYTARLCHTELAPNGVQVYPEASLAEQLDPDRRVDILAEFDVIEEPTRTDLVELRETRERLARGERPVGVERQVDDSFAAVRTLAAETTRRGSRGASA